MGIESVKLDHMRYFIAAVETGSFVGAGERMNITPTSVAHGISAIETALGVELLIRKRAAGVVPNRQGKRFLTACRKVLLEVDNIGEEFQPEPHRLTGDLVVGCQEGVTWSVAPRAIEDMAEQHPDVTVSVRTVFMDDGFAPLENGEVDLMVTFLADKPSSDAHYTKVLCRPQPYALMRGDHPIARRGKSSASLKELAAFPHIFIEDGPAFPLFFGMYEDVGLSPKVSMMSNISPGVQAVVGKTDAVSLRIVRPSINLSPLGDEMAFLKLRDKVMRPYLIAATLKNSQSSISRKAKAFIDICERKFIDGALKENFFY